MKRFLFALALTVSLAVSVAAQTPGQSTPIHTRATDPASCVAGAEIWGNTAASPALYKVCPVANTPDVLALVSQLKFSSLSGSATCGQLPALTGDTTSSAGSCATTTSKVNGTAFSGTTGDLVSFGAANTPADAGFLASNAARKDAANTYGAFSQDFTATTMKVPTPNRAVTGATATDTILGTDCGPNYRVDYQGSVSVAVTLPTATTLGNSKCNFILTNDTTGVGTIVTLTPTTWTLKGSGAQGIYLQNEWAVFHVDPSGTAWDVDLVPVDPYTGHAILPCTQINAGAGADIGQQCQTLLGILVSLGLQGTLVIPTGTYTTSHNIDTSGVAAGAKYSIQGGDGTNPEATFINYTGSGDFIKYSQTSLNNFEAGTISGMHIKGTVSGVSAIHLIDVISLDIRHVTTEGFTSVSGNGGTGIWQDNSGLYTENLNVEHVRSYNNTNGHLWSNSSGSSSTYSFTGTHFSDYYATAFDGQTCFKQISGAMFTGNLSMRCVISAVSVAATCWSQSGLEFTAGPGATMQGVVMDFECENDGTVASNGMVLASGTSLLYSGLVTEIGSTATITDNVNGAATFRASLPFHFRSGATAAQNTKWSVDPATGYFFPDTDNVVGLGLPGALPNAVRSYSFLAHESTAVSGSAGDDVEYGDSTAHCKEASYNNGAFSCVPNIASPWTWTGAQTLSGVAPVSVGTTPGTNASKPLTVLGVAGGATSNVAGVGGIGSSPSIAGGIGGAGTGTNAVGGAGGSLSFTAGNGGASLGTGINANGGNITFTPGAAGSGGSGTTGSAGANVLNGLSTIANMNGVIDAAMLTGADIGAKINTITNFGNGEVTIFVPSLTQGNFATAITILVPVHIIFDQGVWTYTGAGTAMTVAPAGVNVPGIIIEGSGTPSLNGPSFGTAIATTNAAANGLDVKYGDDIVIRGMGFNGTNTAGAGIGLQLSGNGGSLENVEAFHWSGDGIQLNGTRAQANNWKFLKVLSTNNLGNGFFTFGANGNNAMFDNTQGQFNVGCDYKISSNVNNFVGANGTPSNVPSTETRFCFVGGSSNYGSVYSEPVPGSGTDVSFDATSKYNILWLTNARVVTDAGVGNQYIFLAGDNSQQATGRLYQNAIGAGSTNPTTGFYSFHEYHLLDDAAMKTMDGIFVKNGASPRDGYTIRSGSSINLMFDLQGTGAHDLRAYAFCSATDITTCTPVLDLDNSLNTNMVQATATGVAPASVATTPGTNALSVLTILGGAGGATTNASGTGGIGGGASVTAGAGGAASGATASTGGLGGSISLTAGAGGAGAGTGVNANGGSITFTPGIAGAGGSGTAGVMGNITLSGPVKISGEASIVADSAAINTTDTVIVKTLALPANRLLAGTVVRVILDGSCTSTVANASTFTIRWGTLGTTGDGTVAAVVTSTAATTGTNAPFHTELILTVRTVGAAATSDITGMLIPNINTGITALPNSFFVAGTTFNTTTASGILSVSYKSAASTTTSTFKNAFIEAVYQ